MLVERNQVVATGAAAGRPIVFVHGFGCDQAMWRQVAPAFESDHPVIVYDLTGMGQSDLSAYDKQRYSDLGAHAADLLAICEELELKDVVLVGHSIGATIALLAANRAPGLVSQLGLISPTPSFMQDDENSYDGGFARRDLEELVMFLDENHLGWSAQMAPTIAGQAEGQPAASELTQSFCRTDPAIAQHFGRVTFFADARSDFEEARCPSLIVHCDDDALVPMQVADWMRERVPGATLKVLRATGHCPHMTVPEDVVAELRAYLGRG